jgi:hypothetical protein
MTRSGIIETMARAIHATSGIVHVEDGREFEPVAWEELDSDDYQCIRDGYRESATAALAALEAAGLAVVPVEATRAITDAIVETSQIYDEWGVDKYVENPDAVYEAALKAAQGAHKP